MKGRIQNSGVEWASLTLSIIMKSYRILWRELTVIQEKKSGNEQFLICNNSITLKTTHSPLKSIFFFFFGCIAWYVELLQPGIEPTPPALEAWSLNHCTIKKVLKSFLIHLQTFADIGKKKKKKDTEITIVLHLRRENLNSNYSRFLNNIQIYSKMPRRKLAIFFPLCPLKLQIFPGLFNGNPPGSI